MKARLCAVCCLALLWAACKSDDGDGGNAGSGAVCMNPIASGTGGAASMPAMGSGLEACAMPGPVEPSCADPITYLCDANPSQNPMAGTACRNASDCAVIATDMVRERARSCGLSCLGSTDCDMASNCSRNCLINDTKQLLPPGLSEGCATCYSKIVVCNIVFCLTECSANADAPECVACQLRSGCRTAFETCSGLDRMP